MKDLENRFELCKLDHPMLGDVIVMWYAVNGMKYSDDIVRKVFNKCIDKEQYEESEKSEILAYLYRYSMSADNPYKIRSVSDK